MHRSGPRRTALLRTALLVGLASTALAHAAQPAGPPGRARQGGPGTVAWDRNVWQQLLADHALIRRTVVHRQDGDRGIVEATTESDDPAVAARIIDHARAMETRMQVGAQVRVWDGVFKDLFARHDAVTLEVFPTLDGVSIVESSTDPEAVALLRSHAMGVSEFVREGHTAAARPTPRLSPGDALPPGELSLGGVRHRFLLHEPDVAQRELLASQGVESFIDLSDARADATAALDGVRAVLREADDRGAVAALYATDGRTAGPAWAAYRVIDMGEPIERAIAEARAIGFAGPLEESLVRDYIRRAAADPSAQPPGWVPVDIGDLSEAQRAMLDRAAAARDAVFAALLARLEQAIQAPAPAGAPHGPAAAIPVCAQEAPEIARALGAERGVMIGRTSDRLRNPANTAPAWAVALLEERPAEPRFAMNTDGSLGVTLPIRLLNNCLACHGSPEDLAPGVREALARLYPSDAATGYAAGDLRGWFWIEVPPAPHPATHSQATDRTPPAPMHDSHPSPTAAPPQTHR